MAGVEKTELCLSFKTGSFRMNLKIQPGSFPKRFFLVSV